MLWARGEGSSWGTKLVNIRRQSNDRVDEYALLLEQQLSAVSCGHQADPLWFPWNASAWKDSWALSHSFQEFVQAYLRTHIQINWEMEKQLVSAGDL